jgi:hypothetical protein
MGDRDPVKKGGFFALFAFPAGQLRSEKVDLLLSPNMIHSLTNAERTSHNK